MFVCLFGVADATLTEQLHVAVSVFLFFGFAVDDYTSLHFRLISEKKRIIEKTIDGQVRGITDDFVAKRTNVIWNVPCLS